MKYTVLLHVWEEEVIFGREFEWNEENGGDVSIRAGTINNCYGDRNDFYV